MDLFLKYILHKKQIEKASLGFYLFIFVNILQPD